MTLEYVKLFDFNREMNELEIASFINKYIDVDKDTFGLIMLYLTDNFITLISTGNNQNVIKILKSNEVKEAFKYHFKDIEELIKLDR
jgi:hypothetical protein